MQIPKKKEKRNTDPADLNLFFCVPPFLHLHSENPGLTLNMPNHIWNIQLDVPRMAAWRPLLMNRYVPAAHCAAEWQHIFTNPTRTDAKKTQNK